MLLSARTILVVGAPLVCFSSLACSGPQACTGGMCPVSRHDLSEPEVRQRASAFAYKRLVDRQRDSGVWLTGPDGKPISVDPIDPDSWQVAKSSAQWRLERHVTRDIWQVVECNLNGSEGWVFYKVAPPPTAQNGGS